MKKKKRDKCLYMKNIRMKEKKNIRMKSKLNFKYRKFSLQCEEFNTLEERFVGKKNE